ncbi:hypothetical protein B484DRAFT_447241 [Ochromonadaceae sp. CCMP2298]|nr:hypothetical protein B484DRAFT_447241 [Ochromonadaceae sp. CCMP2298]
MISTVTSVTLAVTVAVVATSSAAMSTPLRALFWAPGLLLNCLLKLAFSSRSSRNCLRRCARSSNRSSWQRSSWPNRSSQPISRRSSFPLYIS